MTLNSDRPPPLDIEPELLEHVRACIEDVRAGKMVILVDDEDRENEGDLVFAAEKVTPEHINFMAKYGRGLICLTLTERQVERLELPMMQRPKGRAGPALGTAFTLSIEAREGVTTGISAYDRALTIRVAIRPDVTPDEVVTPGHVFPLRARRGGVLVRTGQTEGSVDLAQLANLNPAGVICEIMNDDGTMARMPDLERFSREHGLRILTIADLIRYRLQTERLVRRVAESDLKLDQTGSTWRAIVYEVSVTNQEYLALVYGAPAEVSAESAAGTLCRMHRGSIVADLFSSTQSKERSEGGRNLRRAIAKIEQAGAGVVVYIPVAGRLKSEIERLGALKLDALKSEPLASEPSAPEPAVPEPAAPRSEAPPAIDFSVRRQSEPLREFGLGAQVLRELGLRKIRLLTTNPKKIVGIRGYGLEVLDTVPLDTEAAE